MNTLIRYIGLRGTLRFALLLALAGATAAAAAAPVRFAVRSQTGHTDVRYYGSQTNDGSAYLSHYVFSSGGTASSKGNQHIGDHDYSGGQLTDVILSDGCIASIASASIDDCVVWNPATGLPLFTNNLGGSALSFRHIAPMPRLRGLAGGGLPAGSLAALRVTSWEANVAIFAREGNTFTQRISVIVANRTNLWEGLTVNADYWGTTLGNVYLAASLVNGTIVLGVTGNRVLFLYNPGSGAETIVPYSADIDWLQGLAALPSGEIAVVGANRKVRLYRPTYAGDGAPVLGAVVHAVDLPGTHGTWVTDAMAFSDGTLGVLIGRARYPAGDGRRDGAVNNTVDVVQRWTREGEFLGSLSTGYDRAGHIAGDAAVQPSRGTVMVIAGTGAAPRPIALVGSSYGRSEVASLLKNTINISPSLEYAFEDRGEYLPGAEFRNYDLVILATAVSNAMTQADADAIGDYLADGGHVLIINQAGKLMAADLGGVAAVDWFGMEQAKWWGGPLITNQPLLSAHSLLRGVFDTNPSPAWLAASTYAVPKPAMQNILGTADGYCLFGLHEVGRGWLAFFGHELFRLRITQMEDSESCVRLLRNVIAAAAPLTNGQLRQQAAEAYRAAGRKLLLWNREWQGGETYGPRFAPPLPEPHELIDALSADLAVDEIESLQLNVTPLFPSARAALSIVDADGFPTNRIAWFVQAAPDPIPWPAAPELAVEVPYWLMPPERVPPLDEAAFSLASTRTTTLWVRLDSHGVAPGTYALVLRLTAANLAVVDIPVQVRVHPVRLPAKRCIALGPAGTVYGDVMQTGPALRFVEELQAQGTEWTFVNALRLSDVGIVGATGTLGTSYFSANRARFEAGDFPMADFSRLDPWFAQALDHNQTRVRAGELTAYLHGPLVSAGYDEATLAATEGWFIREFGRYLAEKGFRERVTSYGDELGAEELRTAFLPWAAQQSGNGWGATSSFSGSGLLDPVLNADLAPHVGLWTLNRGYMPAFMEGLASGALTVRVDAVRGTYGAGEGRGTEHRKALSLSRFLGWESWMWGIENCMVNPYFKGWLYYVDYASKDLGYAGERFVSYVDQDDLSVPLASCPFWEGVREGLEEGNLCRGLAWHLDRLEAVGGGVADNAVRVRGELEAIMGSNATAVIRWQEETLYNVSPYRRIVADNEDFRQGKRRVLELFQEIAADAAAHIPPSLFWNDVALVEAGVATGAIHVGSVGAETLLAAAGDLCPVRVPVFTNAAALDPACRNVVVVGNAAQNPLTGPLLAAWGEADATAGYPGAGSYFIKQGPNALVPGGQVLIVAGPDQEGTARGVRSLAAFLRSEGPWTPHSP